VDPADNLAGRSGWLRSHWQAVAIVGLAGWTIWLQVQASQAAKDADFARWKADQVEESLNVERSARVEKDVGISEGVDRARDETKTNADDIDAVCKQLRDVAASDPYGPMVRCPVRFTLP
jgi:hypothetical protein